YRILPPLRSPLFPYTTLFRSKRALSGLNASLRLTNPPIELEPGPRHGGVRSAPVLESRTAIVRLSCRPISKCADANSAPSGLKADRKSTRLNSSHRTISYAVF